MNRFRFRLEVLLDLRKKKEEKIKLALAEKNNQILSAGKQVTELHDALKALQESEKTSRSEHLDPVLLRYSISYRYILKKRLTDAIRQVDDLKAEASRIQKELVIATQKRKAVEIVKERRLVEWKRKNHIVEQNFNDDISQQAYIRKKS
jgi:flagellar FliJ protein